MGVSGKGNVWLTFRPVQSVFFRLEFGGFFVRVDGSIFYLGLSLNVSSRCYFGGERYQMHEKKQWGKV